MIVKGSLLKRAKSGLGESVCKSLDGLLLGGLGV